MDSAQSRKSRPAIAPAGARRGSGSSGARRCGACSSLPACSSARSRSSAISGLRQGGAMDMATAIHVVGGGLTISLSVIMGLPAVLMAAWIAIRPTRTPFADYLGAALDLVGQFSARRRRARRAGRRLGFAVAHARPRSDAGLHGRRAEIGAGRRRAVAAGDRVLRRGADVGRDLGARFSLSRLVGIKARRYRRHRRCRRWPGPRCTCNTTGSSSARCSASACCSAISATAPDRPG